MTTLREFRSFTQRLPERETPMPVLFVGHGSPMNGIEDNIFSTVWKEKGTQLPLPSAVLCISAHWFTQGTRITAMDFPPTIHDFYGFPPALYEVRYPAPGDPLLAEHTLGLLPSASPVPDHDWGLDHGAWSVIRHLYPEANIPVLQLSIDYTQPPARHFELGKELGALRRKGVLIMGSGNMVHNLRLLNWKKPEGAFDWAEEANTLIKDHLLRGDMKPLLSYESLGSAIRMAIPTPEHFLPLLYAAGLKEKSETTTLFNDQTVMGSVSMTSVQWG
jgi:4,5-DOPA dioxygenase extradiol